MSSAAQQPREVQPPAPADRRASVWTRCRTCGKYLATAPGVSGFCSAECARAYSACVTCGGYFQRGKGFDAEHCSRECATRYRLLRSYGPEPVYLVTEV
jgi:hypothetical protein